MHQADHAPRPVSSVNSRTDDIRSSIKLKQRAIPAHHTHKTADDFMAWLRAKNALKKQAAEVPSARVISQALMVWEDDGGAVAIS